MEHSAPIFALLAALAPTAVAAWTLARASRELTPEGRATVEHVVCLLAWLAPSIAILAGWLAATAFGDHSWPAAAIALASPVAFAWVQTVAERLEQGPPSEQVAGIGRRLRQFAGNLGPAAGTGVFLSFRAGLDGPLYSLSVRTYLFLTISVALGTWLFAHVAPKGTGTWKLLAPCTLRHRIYEAARRAGLEVSSVFVLQRPDSAWAGGLAWQGGNLAISDHLAAGLATDEVDYVVAHELGHIGDRNLWSFSLTRSLAFALAALSAGVLAERAISSAAAGRELLDAAKWLVLPVIGPVLDRWSSRLRERRADVCAADASSPETAIRAAAKLAHLDRLPLRKPVWMRLLSTHPDLGEEIERAARRRGLSGEAVEALSAAALQDLEEPATPRYETAFYDEEAPGPGSTPDSGEGQERKALRRPGRFPVWATCFGVMALTGPPAYWAVSLSLEKWLPNRYSDVHSLIAGFAAVLTAIVLGLLLGDRVDRRLHAQWERRVEEALNKQYPGESAPGDVLVSADFAEASGDIEQLAFFGVREDRMAVVVLGEANCRRISLSAVDSIETDSNNSSKLYLFYYEHNARLWVSIAPFPLASRRNRFNTRKTRKRIMALAAQAQGHVLVSGPHWTLRNTATMVFRGIASAALALGIAMWAYWCARQMRLSEDTPSTALFVVLICCGAELAIWTTSALRPPPRFGTLGSTDGDTQNSAVLPELEEASTQPPAPPPGRPGSSPLPPT